MCDSITGFGVRKSPKTRKVVFFLRKVIDGKDRRIRLGTHKDLSVRAARKLAARRLLEIEEAGGEPRKTVTTTPAPREQPTTPDPRIDEILQLMRGDKPAKAPTITFGELWKQVSPGWLASLKADTRKNLAILFESRILPKWADTPVDQIQTANLTKWYHSFLEKAPQYGALATRRVIYLLKLGHEQGLVKDAPSFKIRFVAPKRRQPLERDAVCNLVTALESVLQSDPDNSNAKAIIAIMNTGERATAGAQLHTREVDYKQMCITKERKFGQVKKIPMSNYTASFLRSIHPKGGGYFFPNKRDPSLPIKYNALLAFLKSMCGRHGIRTRGGSIPTLHCIRHTYATLLEEQGLPVSHIQRLLGHSSMDTTMRYIHGSVDGAREGANRLEVTRVQVRGKRR